MRSLRFLTAAAVASALPVYIYTDEWNQNTPVDEVLKKYVEAGATHLVLAFHLMLDAWPNNVADTVKWLYEMPAESRKKTISELHGMGAEIILSTAGGSAGTSWFNFTPQEYAKSACGLAAEWGLDGVDFDLESLPAGFGSYEGHPWAKWSRDVVVECKKYFNGYITAAPQSPYLMKSFAGGSYGFDTYGYDRLLVQYYNQGGSFGETTIAGVFEGGEGSIVDLMQRHPTAAKNSFVVGKPLVDPEDGIGGGFSMETLRTEGCKLYSKYGWTGGFMFWRGHHDRPATQEMIKQIAVPCPGESTGGQTVPPVTTTTTTTTPRPTTTTTTTPRRTTTTTTTKPPVVATTTQRPVTYTTRPITYSTRPSVTQAPATYPTQPPVVTESEDHVYPTACPVAAIGPIVSGCLTGMKPTEAYWSDACGANCLMMGPGGCLSHMCNSESSEQLLACLTQYFPHCG